MAVWMGLTVGCAQCHTHKFDPILHTEYYSLYAFFNQSKDSDKPSEQPTLDLASSELRAAIEAVREELAALPAGAAADADGEEAAGAPDREAERARLTQELSELESSVPWLPVMEELAADERRATHVFERGSFLAPGQRVEAATPSALHPFPGDAPRNRRGLARWLTDPANPLTARVQVNRYWEQFFGTGLVETVEDFGYQGAAPSHPELLDWLALELVESGWSLKALCRQIVTSETYCQASETTPAQRALDPNNRLLARGPRFRLPAEAIRDQALAVAGLLSPKLFGPPVMPYQPEGIWQIVYSGDRWQTSDGEDRHRRALYTFLRRTAPYPTQVAFDGSARSICLVRRSRTNTPLQALVTLNDPTFVEAAQAFGRLLISAAGDAHDFIEARIEHAYLRSLMRPVEPEELAVLRGLYATEREYYERHPELAASMACDPLGPLPEGMDAADAAAMSVLCNVILNLDEFLTKG
jgi:hypothetical protein